MSASEGLRRMTDRAFSGKRDFDPSSWKVPYGTMMLLCMIFFMILYAIASSSGVKYEGVIARLQSDVSREKSSMKDVEMAEKFSEIFKDGQGVIKMDAGKIRIMMDAPILFDSGSSDLKETSRGVLHNVALALLDTENKVIVAGHTDNIPYRHLEGGNFELSTLRAFSVILYFIDEEKIPAKRFSAYGFGEYSPLASNETADGRLQNRRIEISVMREKKPVKREG